LLAFWNSNVNNEVAAYDSQVMYKVEGRKILSNEDTCNIVYVGRAEDTESYDSMLSSTIASALAAETAYAVTGSSNIAQLMEQRYQNKLREARSADATEGMPDRIMADDFINVRF
jgi:hypothetical protein